MMKPAPPLDEILHRVTYHAVTRYVQRVIGITVPLNERLPEAERAHIHCRCAKTTVDDVRRAILIPTVAIAIENKFAAIDTRHFTAVIDPDQQIVVTILDPQKYKNREGGRSSARSEKLCFRIAERVGKQIRGVSMKGRMK